MRLQLRETDMLWRPPCRILCVAALMIVVQTVTRADDPERPSVEDRRLLLMQEWARDVTFRAGSDADFPARVESDALFRYDDLTRGYVDGAVWRLGATGRPRALVTTELNPDYLGGGQRIVYEFLSLTDVPFTARSSDVAGWTPSQSALSEGVLSDGPTPAATAERRLFQLKQIAGRFSAMQEVEDQHLRLRLLPRPIDRYAPSEDARADAAMFLFVSGRMPGVVLLIETDGGGWRYGIGRLSAPSVLTVTLDGEAVWNVEPAALGWDQPYVADNSAVLIPGFEESNSLE